jgi:hypothetical protein
LNKSHRLPVALAALCLAGGCAKQAPPPGGPEDRVAPALGQVFPEAGTVGVSRTQPVRLSFTKSMQKSEVEGALHLFPPPASPPRLHWEGHDLVVTPDTAWEADETYILTLQSEATDIRGNRLSATFQTAFSTGAQIDSGLIEGQVLRNAAPASGVLALCFRLPSDRLNPETDTADYVVQTDSSGRFKFAFLRTGQYRIFGLADRDRDWLWNIGTEEIAVPAQDVSLGDRGEAARLPALHLTQLDTTLPVLLTCEPLSDTWVKLSFDAALDSAWLDSVTVTLAGERDTLAAVLLLSRDSLSTTVFARFPISEAGLGRRELRWTRRSGGEPLFVCAIEASPGVDSTSPLEPSGLRPDTNVLWSHLPERLSWWFDRPLDSVLPTHFLWEPPAPSSALLVNAFEVAILLTELSRPPVPEALAVAPGAVRGPGGGVWPSQDTVHVRLKVPPEDSLGDYEIRMEGVPGPPGETLILTLRSLAQPTPDVARNLKADLPLSGRLARGDYSVSLLMDDDGNGHWSTGWPSPFAPSERLWFPADTLRVRARFTTEYTVSLVR